MSPCKIARAMVVEHLRRGASMNDPHLETCQECTAFAQTQRDLHTALTTLSQEPMNDINLQRTLLAEFDAPRHAAMRRVRRWLPAAALATVLAIAAIVIHRPAAISAEQPFVEIPYIAPLAPYERTTVVRMDVPASALIAAGYDLHSPDTGAAFPADVLLGQDGRAHAIRLVARSIPNPIGD